jgi:hypothetical protein
MREAVIRHHLDAAAVEDVKRRTMADGNDGRAFQPVVQQAIQRFLGGFIERSRYFSGAGL